MFSFLVFEWYITQKLYGIGLEMRSVRIKRWLNTNTDCLRDTLVILKKTVKDGERRDGVRNILTNMLMKLNDRRDHIDAKKRKKDYFNKYIFTPVVKNKRP